MSLGRPMRYNLSACLCAVALLGGDRAGGAEPATIAVAAPRPHLVVQRGGYDHAAKPKPGDDAFGFADVVVRADFGKATDRVSWEYRVVLLAGGQGREVGWTKLDVRGPAVTARVPAGGWYRLEVRGRGKDDVTHRGHVEPVGVGEVFLVAGQSYASNSNDERLKVADPRGRVAALNAAAGTWAVAHDPQPTPDGSDGGSIWPPLGDALVREFGVPVGFANVAVGGTSSQQWLPTGTLHPRLVQAGTALGRFRAVLWQQGESDVIAKTTTADYVANLRTIRAAAVKPWGFEPPWLLAKSTHHPTVYNDEEGEGRIRKAIDELAKLPGFAAGPDTDALRGDNRGGSKTRRHFSGVGQRRAADLWFAVLKQRVTAPPPRRDRLAELKLLEPVWSSPVVHRESSVLMQARPAGPVTARLAFPTAEIVEISTADRRHRFDPSRDVSLSADGRTVTFAKPGPVVPLQAADLFPPKDAPHSYRHRTGHPEQNLLYRPGRWFHDRNVEVTYRRREAPTSPTMTAGTLPKTVARLAAGKALTLGVSGDSISTGLDASALVNAPPNQPGYPDLVAAQVQAAFGCDVALKNRAVSGWSVANGVKDLDKLLAEKPHLIVVAYGMNDVGRRDPKWFGTQTRAILDRVRAADADAEVILVSPMLGHGEWVHTPREMFAKYRDELKALTGPGVALADVTAVWELLLRHKHDLDLTGNGLNHPNDFGHRVYAQVVLSLLVPVSKRPGSR